MKNIIIASSLFLFTTSAVYGQQDPLESNVPANIRQMIEQSQGGSRFAQMARMQASAQYGAWLNSLEGNVDRRRSVEEALIEVLAERAELSDRTVTGEISPTQLAEITNYNYLRDKLAPLLNGAELSALDNLRGGSPTDQLRRSYDQQLARIADSLSDAERESVLETLVGHMEFADGGQDVGTDPDALVAAQLDSLAAARQELQSSYTGEKLEQINTFLNQLQSNLYRNRRMYENMNM
ncbi:MAG: hypothetical protein RKH07_08690 [Gammaproteobacteria bacterium]